MRCLFKRHKITKIMVVVVVVVVVWVVVVRRGWTMTVGRVVSVVARTRLYSPFLH